MDVSLSSKAHAVRPEVWKTNPSPRVISSAHGVYPRWGVARLSRFPFEPPANVYRAAAPRLRPTRQLERRPREGSRGSVPEGHRSDARAHWPIDIWGDGSATRSFTYIDDCVVGIDRSR